ERNMTLPFATGGRTAGGWGFLAPPVNRVKRKPEQSRLAHITKHTVEVGLVGPGRCRDREAAELGEFVCRARAVTAGATIVDAALEAHSSARSTRIGEMLCEPSAPIVASRSWVESTPSPSRSPIARTRSRQPSDVRSPSKA